MFRRSPLQGSPPKLAHRRCLKTERRRLEMREGNHFLRALSVKAPSAV